MVSILFLGDFFKDARCINMADSLIDAGQKITVIDAGHGANKYREQPIVHIDLRNYSRGFKKYWQYYKQTKKKLKELNPQTMIIGDLYSLPASVVIPHARIIYDSREIYTHLAGLSSQPLKQKFWAWIENRFIGRTSTIMVTAESDAGVLQGIYDGLKYATIKNLPSKKRKPPENNPLLRDHLGIHPQTHIFLYQGMIHAGRGILTVIDLLDHFENAHAVFLGEGPFLKEAKEHADKKSLSERVHFLGMIPYSKLLNYTSGACIGFSLIEPLSLSYKHALPNKIFEYALSGIPVISTDFPEMDSVIKEFKLGKTVPHNDSSALITAVEELLTQKKNHYQETALESLVWESQTELFLATVNG